LSAQSLKRFTVSWGADGVGRVRHLAVWKQANQSWFLLDMRASSHHEGAQHLIIMIVSGRKVSADVAQVLRTGRT
jgi:hypothetical protein